MTLLLIKVAMAGTNENNGHKNHIEKQQFNEELVDLTFLLF